ncbi:MAG: cytidine deaminase-like protein [Monoraphidium minutum]|nr:MAG: cytidine deaminase-like protein [Monoraphidium minutum]
MAGVRLAAWRGCQRRWHPRPGADAGGGCDQDGGGVAGGCAFAPSLSLVSPVDAKKAVGPFRLQPAHRWDDYFMSVAFLSAQRSKDPNKQVGAVIVSPDNIILSIGYNGFPRGCPDGALPWAKKSRSGNVLDTKYPYVVHAEANALLNKNQASVAGTRVYVTMFPCNECAKLLIQAGITEVIYHESKVESVKHHPALTAPLIAGGCAPGCSEGAGADAADADAFSFPTPGGGGGGGACAARVAVGAPDDGYVASRRLLTMAGLALRQHKLRGLVIVNPSA